MSKTMQWINTKLSMFLWTIRYAWNYFLLNFHSASTVSRNNIFLVLLFLVITPWLSGLFWLSAIVDVLSVFLFFQLIQDKIRAENEKAQIRERIQTEIANETSEILEFFERIGVLNIKHLDNYVTEEIINGISDYEFFDTHRYKYVFQVSNLLLQIQAFDGKLKYYLHYLIFSELKTKYRQQYIDENIDVRNFDTIGSNEEALIRHIAYRVEVGNVCLDSSWEKRKIKPDKYIAIEFGNKIYQSKITKIIADKEKAEKLKEILTQGIVNGLISDKGLESITRNQNKLFVIIKYGEGTSVDGWPRGLTAPLPKVLRRHKFEKPYNHDDFTFIRDLNANPIQENIEAYTDHLIRELKGDYSGLKQKYKNKEVIQDGPHYEILAFIADKKNFAWRLSRKRNFNSFINQMLLNEVIEGEFSKDFIRANFFKIKKIIEGIVWFSLIKNQKLKEQIETNIKKVDKELMISEIKLETLFDLVSLKPAQVELLIETIHKIVKKRNISAKKARTTDKEKVNVIKKQIKALMKEAESFTSIVRDLEK